jgi:hypothetical protein
MHTVKQRVYRDKDGNPTTDPEKAVSLLYAEGVVISDEEAEAAGLTGAKTKSAAAKDASAKDVPAAPATKDVKGPKGRK